MDKMRIFSLFLFVLLCPATIFGGQVNTFIYHRFDEARYPSTNISSEIFRDQLDYLKNNGIEVISLGEIAERLQAGRSLPEHAVALCADDSYRSFSAVAMPLVRKYGFPITLFVNTGAVGTPGYLGWDELKVLVEQGVEIGNHTTTHPYLVELADGEDFESWRQRVRRDIVKAQDDFETHLGIRPELFAYPYGEYSDAVVTIIKELGFKAAFAQQSGVIHDRSQLYHLPRFPMGGPYATLSGFVNKYKMVPLPVVEQEPFDPVIRVENPPVLTLRLSGPYRTDNFNCFVQGQNSCRVENARGKDGEWIRIVAEKPLSGRRNKYTLTIRTADGRWAWFSHPWINADRPHPDSDAE